MDDEKYSLILTDLKHAQDLLRELIKEEMLIIDETPNLVMLHQMLKGVDHNLRSIVNAIEVIRLFLKLVEVPS